MAIPPEVLAAAAEEALLSPEAYAIPPEVLAAAAEDALLCPEADAIQAEVPAAATSPCRAATEYDAGDGEDDYGDKEGVEKAKEGDEAAEEKAEVGEDKEETYTKWLDVRCWVQCDLDGEPLKPYTYAGPCHCTPQPGYKPRGDGVQTTLTSYMKVGMDPSLLPGDALASASSDRNETYKRKHDGIIHAAEPSETQPKGKTKRVCLTADQKDWVRGNLERWAVNPTSQVTRDIMKDSVRKGILDKRTEYESVRSLLRIALAKDENIHGQAKADENLKNDGDKDIG
jgi:hypothetical protein